MKHLLILLILFSSCTNNVKPPIKCKNSIKGKAVLIAYRVSKHSHLWFQNPITKQIYDISGVGGRRKPNISLGDTINVEYCNNKIIFNKYKYVKKPFNGETRFIYLTQFNNHYYNGN